MIVVAEYDSISSVTDELVAHGYGYSCLGGPRNSNPDRGAIIEMLKDWGWSGRGAAPAWLVGAT